jgi:hypothetical protein
MSTKLGDFSILFLFNSDKLDITKLGEGLCAATFPRELVLSFFTNIFEVEFELSLISFFIVVGFDAFSNLSNSSLT